jgi:hypothetical protein
MNSRILRRARFLSGFRFASMQIPEKKAQISSDKVLTSIFGAPLTGEMEFDCSRRTMMHLTAIFLVSIPRRSPFNANQASTPRMWVYKKPTYVP